MKSKFALTSLTILALLAPAFGVQAQTVTGLSCSVQSANVWANGYQGDVTVTNTGDTAVSGWCVVLGFNKADGVSTLWNATQVDETSTIKVCNNSWNGALAPGGSTTFGFTDTHDGNVTLPTCTAMPN
jgi:cellulase/cellobiase CelA1